MVHARLPAAVSVRSRNAPLHTFVRLCMGCFTSKWRWSTCYMPQKCLSSMLIMPVLSGKTSLKECRHMASELRVSGWGRAPLTTQKAGEPKPLCCVYTLYWVGCCDLYVYTSHNTVQQTIVALL